MSLMMVCLTRVRRLTSSTVSPARRRAAASVAPTLTRASQRCDRFLCPRLPAIPARRPGRLSGTAAAVFPGAAAAAGGAQRRAPGPGLGGKLVGEGGEPGAQRAAVRAGGRGEDADGQQA